MQLTDEHIKLILGLKLKNFRQEKGLSLIELSRISKLSVSYINEIESGKKFPKIDKLQALANALEINYEDLISLKLTKNLKPISELLESNLLKILPLHHYGIDINKLITTMASASAPIGALILAFIDSARGSESSQNNFSKNALRTFKEFYEDYFEEIETAVDTFRLEIGVDKNSILSYSRLSEQLKNQFQYKIDENKLNDYSELQTLRAAYFPETKSLFLNNILSEKQKAFIIAKEIAFNYLKINERSNLHAEKALETFDHLLNNFYASYFANALLLPKEIFLQKLTDFFKNPTFQPEFLLELPNYFHATPEMIFQRITNLLPKYFGINQFFYLRFNSNINSDNFYLTKELRLNTEQNPGGNKHEFHFCRRWVSIQILDEMKAKVRENIDFNNYLSKSLKSTFHNSQNQYINISLAKHRRLSKDVVYSVTIGILLNEKSKSIIKFWNDENIESRVVSDNCETCPIQNCIERVAEPTELEKYVRSQNFDESLLKLGKTTIV